MNNCITKLPITNINDRQKMKQLLTENMNTCNLGNIITFLNDIIANYELEALHLTVCINTIPQLIFNLFGNLSDT
jgi:predicted aldo/keto reductase-like oxidoreductase